MGELQALYVEPAHWATGTGRLLLQHATARMLQSGFQQSVLWVLQGNERARRFYDADGWQHDGAARRENVYGVESDVIRLRRSLA